MERKPGEQSVPNELRGTYFDDERRREAEREWAADKRNAVRTAPPIPGQSRKYGDYQFENRYGSEEGYREDNTRPSAQPNMDYPHDESSSRSNPRSWGYPREHESYRGESRSAEPDRAEQASTGEHGRYAGVGPRGYTRADVRLETEICEALMRDPDIDASRLNVQVNRGAVHLSGTVPDEHMRDLAAALARNVPGVAELRSDVTVGGAAQGAS